MYGIERERLDALREQVYSLKAERSKYILYRDNHSTLTFEHYLSKSLYDQSGRSSRQPALSQDAILYENET